MPPLGPGRKFVKKIIIKKTVDFWICLCYHYIVRKENRPMTKTKYVAINTLNNEPILESESYKVLHKMLAKSISADKEKSIKIYKKVITETLSEIGE